MPLEFKIVNETFSSGNEGRVFDDELSGSWAFVAEDSDGKIAVNGIVGHEAGMLDEEGNLRKPTLIPNHMRGAHRPGIIKDRLVTIVEPGTVFAGKLIATETEWTEKKD